MHVDDVADNVCQDLPDAGVVRHRGHLHRLGFLVHEKRVLA